MKKVFLLFCFCCALFLITACSSQEQREDLGLNQDIQEELKKHLQVFCSEKMTGREGGTRGEAEAALYIAEFLEEKGLKPVGDEGTYFQSFAIKEYAHKQIGKRMTFGQISSLDKGTSDNVLALLEGRTKEVIVVSAHYDHLGVINGQLYPGANDNASGVSAVLEIINGLAADKPERTILFAFWGSEEKGLLGSRYFCAHPTIPWEQIKCIINFDTIGNLDGDKLLLGWKEKDNEVTEEIIERLVEEDWQISWENDPAHSSDHYPFSLSNVPGFTLLSPAWLENNHTPLDNAEAISIPLLQELVYSLINVLKK